MRSCKITADKRYLLLPVSGEGGWFLPADRVQTLSILCRGELREEYEVLLSETPRCWSPVYLERYFGEELELRLEGGREELLERLELSDRLKDRDTLYRERERPLAHFTPMHGFMNDPNGLFYYRGTYHYFSQLNPYGFGPANTHWLHAVSADLMHWKELPYALLPDETGRMYSGSGVVDYANTSGLQAGEDPPILLFYTPAGSKSRWSRGRYFEVAAAVSLDGGRSFQKYRDNPVVKHLAYMNRDPKVVWDPEGDCWIMALFLDNDRYRLLFSQNLLDWKAGQTIAVRGSAECPDLFRLPLDGDPEKQRWVLWGSTDNYLVGGFTGRGEARAFVPETETVEGPSHKADSAYSSQLRTSGEYAAQTYFGAPEGRVLQQSWIRTRTQDAPFSSCTSVPNELRLVSTPEGPRLSVLPAKEVEGMYRESFSFRDRGVEEIERIPARYLGECMDMTFRFGVTPGRLIAVSVRGVLIVYDPAGDRLLLPNGCFSLPQNGSFAPRARDTLALRVITDRCSLELYTGDGLFHTVLATVLDPEDISINIVSLDPSTAVDFELHKLGNAWTDPEPEREEI